MRTFISIELTDKIKDNIEKVISRLKEQLAPINWVEKKNLHVTLKFLGNVEENDLGSLEDCVKQCTKGFKPFELSFAGIGAFPDLKHPRVLWIGTDVGGDKAKELADNVECEVSKKGFREEERDFSPHLTIGGIKGKIDLAPLEGFISQHKDTGFGSVTVDRISIMKSTLKRTGPVYEEIKQISF